MLHLLGLLIMQILLLGKLYHHTLLSNKGRNSSMICVPEYEQQAIIRDFHDNAYEGHHVGDRHSCKGITIWFLLA
jgi:hypothetical protein